nr:hypothetical protein [Tanacetum cinerariifolium]
METKDTLSSCSNSEAQQMQQIQDKAKKSCMIYFRQLHSHLKRLSQNDLQGSQKESVFKRAFTTLSGQDTETFTGTMAENAEECHDTCPLLDIFTDNQIPEHPYQSLESEKDWKPMSQPLRNQLVVRQPTAFKSERPRFSKPRCDSQVDVHNDLSKPVNTHYLPKEREAASAKPHHMIASSNFRISTKNMTRFSSNDITVPIAEHSRNSRNDSCVTRFLKEVNSRAKVPSNKTTNRNKPIEQNDVPYKQERQIPTGHRFSIQKTSAVQKKTMTPRSCLRWKQLVLTGKIFKTAGLRWVPTGKIFDSSTTKVDSEPRNGSNADITNQYECEQTLDVSAGTLNLSAGTSFNPKEEGLKVCSELGLHDHSNEQSSSQLVPDVVPPAEKTATETSVANNTSGLVPQRQKASDYDNPNPVPRRQDVSSSTDAHVPSQQELDLLFGHLYDEFFNAGSNPSTNIQSTITPSTNINVHAEENNNDQAEEGE